MPVNGRPLLSYQLERLRRSESTNGILVATTIEPDDSAIVDLCARERVECFRGPENDVLSRYAMAAEQVNAKVVVRITSDCPLIDPGLIDYAIGEFVNSDGRYDYVSNMLEPSWPYGMAVEVFSRAALVEADREATETIEREHVTPFVYQRPQRYHLKSLVRQPDLSGHRWTVDTPEDFELVSKILGALYPRLPNFDLSDVLALLESNPAWATINSHVSQKVVLQKN